MRKSRSLAPNRHGSYFVSALSKRLSLVALFVSVLSLVAFLGAIAWAAWAAAVLIICVLSGLLVSLQLIVYGCLRIAPGFAWILRSLARLYVSCLTRELFGRGADAQGKCRLERLLRRSSSAQAV